MIVIVVVMVVVAAAVVVNKRRPTRHYQCWGGDGGVTTDIKLNFKNEQINKRIIETQFKSVKT